LTEICITPRIETELDGERVVKSSYCENCGVLTTRRTYLVSESEEVVRAMAREDGERFMLHLDTHYQDYSSCN